MLALILAAVLVVIDQIIKGIVSANLKPVGSVEFIPGIINFTYVENRGAAFGILQNQRWFFIIITVIACIGVIYMLFKYGKTSRMLYFGLTLILGGAIGNFIDRLFSGFVVDFIELAFVNFAIFNFADCCVTIGAVIVSIYFLFIDGSKKAEIKDEAQA
ncbi:MAG: signal peptidase II [Christensenellales bacterium]